MNEPDDDDERQADDEDTEPAPENEAQGAALMARIVIREMLDEVQGAISRTRTAGMARVDAASHVQNALAYLPTPHVGQAATHCAWAMAYLDVAGKRAKLPEAIAARWAEVRAALPESVRQAMGDRTWAASGGRRKQRAARPVTPTSQGEQRRGA